MKSSITLLILIAAAPASAHQPVMASKKVSKLPFIDQSKYTKGVKVEIEKQKLTIAVMPDQELDIPTLFEAITSGGYEPVDVWTVTATGEIDEPVEYRP